jgi:hypothetical protein
MHHLDPTTTGIIVTIGTVVAVLAAWFLPRREPESGIGLSLEAAALQIERNRMHSAAVGVAEDVGMPYAMDPALMDLADRMALDVHEGRRTPDSAIQHMTAVARRWTREMAGAPKASA